MSKQLKHAYVACYNNKPIIVTHTKEDMEEMLAEYAQATLVNYKAHNPKYPDDLEGWYIYYDPIMDENVEFTIYCAEYKRENL